MGTVDTIEMTTRPEIRLPSEERERYLNSNGITETTPRGSSQLGPLTVVCLVLNRTIGSGIFVTPALVLSGTGTVGASLFLWAAGGLVATCGLLVWLELGLSLPLLPTGDDRALRAVPRSGGEKNYLEFIYKSTITDRPRYLVKCMYGVAFVLLGNLTGNAIALGIYVMNAAGQKDPAKGPVTAIAIAALTAVVLLHIITRRGSIIINNCFAFLKVAILLVIFIIGMIKAGGNQLNGAPKATYNFDSDKSFSTARHDLSSYTNSLLYIVYAYSGFEQPFYVLAEIKHPRKTFPRYTLLAMAIVTVLFVLVNIAYFCAVPSNLPDIAETRNMAVVFFGQVFGDEVAKRVMAGVIAVSIFGNILVMTFTASKVKQEIAKEGILPFSLTFATSHTTLWAKWSNRNKKLADDEVLEQTPMAALGLHWITSIILVLATMGLKPAVAYSFLVSLYSYSIVIMIGFFTSAGLLYLKFRKGRKWQPNFRPRGGPIYAAVYGATCLFMLFAAFDPPDEASPYGYAATGIQWYLVPAIGLSVPFWGVLWYGCLRAYMAIRGMVLLIERNPTTERDDVVGYEDQYIMVSEHITQDWHWT
ncbi:high-affinity methionine permease [Podospora australis]|uniref:High-affinity methionine permease n=1 Tax=Podospora australis TaxID=1536484 RepID=A0AAN7AGE5_9PEZI|nr:high-affinity methionine permease [Podospora australis]